MPPAAGRSSLAAQRLGVGAVGERRDRQSARRGPPCGCPGTRPWRPGPGGPPPGSAGVGRAGDAHGRLVGLQHLVDRGVVSRWYWIHAVRLTRGGGPAWVAAAVEPHDLDRQPALVHAARGEVAAVLVEGHAAVARDPWPGGSPPARRPGHARACSRSAGRRPPASRSSCPRRSARRRAGRTWCRREPERPGRGPGAGRGERSGWAAARHRTSEPWIRTKRVRVRAPPPRRRACPTRWRPTPPERPRRRRSSALPRPDRGPRDPTSTSVRPNRAPSGPGPPPSDAGSEPLPPLSKASAPRRTPLAPRCGSSPPTSWRSPLPKCESHSAGRG